MFVVFRGERRGWALVYGRVGIVGVLEKASEVDFVRVVVWVFVLVVGVVYIVVSIFVFFRVFFLIRRRRFFVDLFFFLVCVLGFFYV